MQQVESVSICLLFFEGLALEEQKWIILNNFAQSSG